mmetsp:Transcript_129722/g.258792  ORF Transcript_129722/g.258792 Transcript_129722/m.258792 type:complete len:346 (+) Transcript_129722:50-1087(+)
MTTLTVSKPATISELCETAGLTFSAGCGFYEVVKQEQVSGSKEMVALEKATGHQVVGGQQVRQRLGLANGNITVAPKSVKAGWTLYVQSTSHNRKLPAGSTVFIKSQKDTSPAKATGVHVSTSKPLTTAKREAESLKQEGPPVKRLLQSFGASSTLRGVRVPSGWSSVDSLLVKTDPACKATSKIAAFDFDDCLAKTSMAGFDPNAWKMLFAHVPTVLKKLHSSGHKIVIITNESMERFKQPDAIMKAILKKTGRLDGFAAACDVPMQLLCATAKDEYRKPAIGAWTFLVNRGNGSVKPDLSSSFFVGDAAGRPKDHSDSDKAFAEAIGITFHTETEFFKELHKS